MKFDLVHLWYERLPNSGFVYRSQVTHGGLAGSRQLQDRNQLIEIMSGILEAQPEPATFNQVLIELESNGTFQFTGPNALDLTEEQAESLGWNRKGTKT